MLPPCTCTLHAASKRASRQCMHSKHAGRTGVGVRTHPVSGAMPPSAPRVPAARARVSAELMRATLFKRERVGPHRAARRARDWSSSCCARVETPAQHEGGRYSRSRRQPRRAEPRTCVNSSRMSRCLASVCARASPVLVTVLRTHGARQQRRALGRCPDAPAHGVVDVGQPLQQRLDFLAPRSDDLCAERRSAPRPHT